MNWEQYSVFLHCLIHRLIASMHINIHDVHVEALNFVMSWCIDAFNQWIKQCKVLSHSLQTPENSLSAFYCIRIGST